MLTDLAGASTNTEKSPIIPKGLKAESMPLSFAQFQMWVMDQMSPGNPAYSLPIAYRLTGNLNIVALENSFNEIIRRHAVLRTTFTISEGEARQIIHDACRIEIGFTTLDDLPKPERERRLHELASEAACVPFNLSQLPLIRAHLFRMSTDDHVLFINIHHIVADGMSLGLILSELDHHYQTLTEAVHHELPELPMQYADYSRLQREAVEAKGYASEAVFWRRKLEAAPSTLDLPTDLQRPPLQSFKGSNVFFQIPNSVSQPLHALGAREGCTFFTVLLAAFEVLLHRYTRADDLVIGTPVSVRMPADVELLIGNFLNMIPLRCDLSGDPTFLQVLRRTRKTTLQAFSRSSIPFERIVENVSFQRDPSRNPIFQVMVEMLPAVTSHIGDLQVQNFYFDLCFAQFDLSFHAWEESYGYACRFEYCTDLFAADTIQRLSANFLQLLSEIVADPEQKIATIPILTDSEKRRVLTDWNRTSLAYPADRCVSQLFEATVARNRNRVAVECAGDSLTYGELDESANHLANYLVACGIKNENLVGIYLDRSPDLIIGLLAILKAGAAYVPLDPLFPPERLAYMINDAQISVVITQSRLQETLPAGNRKVICLDSDRSRILSEPATVPPVPLSPENLAYTIYTSGSSGRPKGVMIEHRSLVNCLTSMQNEPGFSQGDVLVAVTTISFDIAALEMFLPLISGGKLVIASKNEAMDGSALADLLQRTHATVLQATPITWRLLLDAGWRASPPFKMLCGGEALPRDLANRLLDSGGQLWNMYGPTETTIWSSVARVEATPGPVPVGPPIANTQFYIVDENFEPVPIGVPGELLIGGDGVARGYLNRADLTAERFVMKRIAGAEARLYKTGDLTRLRSDGHIEFLGRLDFQVKVRGYRIELREIEHVLAGHASVKDVAVVTWDEPDGDKRLVAYYVPFDGRKPADGDLREYLHEKLPDYMCPSLFVELETFPLTPNGKVDRKSFPKPELANLKTRPTVTGPQRPLEARLIAMWEEVLKRRPIGLDDNFFNLGGHSLLAARLFANIEKTLGTRLPLAALFHSPTVRTLAARLEQQSGNSEWHSLVPIQTRGSNPPLFLVHGAEGNVLLYRSLAQCLGVDQPLYGLQSRGLDGGAMGEARIESIAAQYLREIRVVQPVGPYYLGGYCLGGTIALEIAQQLRRAGESVALLAMIESYNVRSRPPAAFPLKTIHKVQNLVFQARNLFLSGGSTQYFAEKLQVEFSRLKVYGDILREKVASSFRPSRSGSYAHLRVQKANHQAQAAYEPLAYDGRIALFRPKVHFLRFNDRYFGWKHIAMNGINVVEMPSYPHGSLNQPFVTFLAQAIKSEIEKTLQESARP